MSKNIYKGGNEINSVYIEKVGMPLSRIIWMKENKISIMSFYFQESPRPYLSMEPKSTRKISIKVKYSFVLHSLCDTFRKFTEYIFFL